MAAVIHKTVLPPVTLLEQENDIEAANKARKKAQNDRKRKSREKLMRTNAKSYIENNRKHQKTYYNAHRELNAELSELSNEPARLKWDRNYQERQIENNSVRLRDPVTTKWLERPQEKLEKYKNQKRINRVYEKLQYLESKLAEAKCNSTGSDATGLNAASLISREEKERFLVNEITLDAKYVCSLSECLLNLKYLEMVERSNILYGKGYSYNEVITSLTAESLVAAGNMAGGAGFFGMEHCVAEKARTAVFSPEEMVRITVETSCNLSNINEVAKCQATLNQGEVGFMYKKTTITQTGLDVMAGIKF